MNLLMENVADAVLTVVTLFSICHVTKAPMASMPITITAKAMMRNCPARVLPRLFDVSEDTSLLLSAEAYTVTIPQSPEPRPFRAEPGERDFIKVELCLQA